MSYGSTPHSAARPSHPLKAIPHSPEDPFASAQARIVDRSLRMTFDAETVVILPFSGVVVMNAETDQRRAVCAGQGLLLPRVRQLSLVQDPLAAGRTLVLRLDSTSKEMLLQDLAGWETSFESGPLVVDLLHEPIGTAVGESAVIAILDYLGWRYAEHLSAMQRLPGTSAHRRNLYARLLNARIVCEQQLDTRIGDLGERFHLSQAHFVRLFRTAFGIGPQQHLIRCRLLRALAMLTWSSVPVNEISEACGYTDRTAFSRSFSRIVGAAPAEVRAQMVAAADARCRFFYERVYEIFRC